MNYQLQQVANEELLKLIFLFKESVAMVHLKEGILIESLKAEIILSVMDCFKMISDVT